MIRKCKFLFVFFFLTNITLSMAMAKDSAKDLSFRCITTMPTTSFLLRTEGKEVVLTTIHHNGTPYMPIHEGIVVPHDFSYLQSVANHLTLMGDSNEFRFPKNKCQIYGHALMSCHGGERKVFNGEEMEALSLHTAKIKEAAFGETSEKIKVVLSVNVLYDGECKFDF
jgi:hypothetical protein